MTKRQGNAKSTPKKRSAGDWREPFLASLASDGNVRAACNAAGIDRRTAYNHRDGDEEFRHRWDAAMEEACDLLAAEARRRALECSDTLLIFLLKAHRPDVYRERGPSFTAEMKDKERSVTLAFGPGEDVP